MTINHTNNIGLEFSIEIITTILLNAIYIVCNYYVSIPKMTYSLKLRICYAVLELNSYNLWREHQKMLFGQLVIDLNDLNFPSLAENGVLESTLFKGDKQQLDVYKNLCHQ